MCSVPKTFTKNMKPVIIAITFLLAQASPVDNNRNGFARCALSSCKDVACNENSCSPYETCSIVTPQHDRTVSYCDESICPKIVCSPPPSCPTTSERGQPRCRPAVCDYSSCQPGFKCTIRALNDAYPACEIGCDRVECIPE